MPVAPASPPFVSVVTVSLNAESTIEDTIASVHGQLANFPIEHICVDGGSRDQTRQKIDRCVAQGVSLTRIYEPDRGIYDAMNKGLRAAKGEYVLFLNADDFLATDMTLASAMEGLTPNSPNNPDLVLGNVSMGKLEHYGIWRHRRAPLLLGRLPGWGLFPIHPGQFSKRVILEKVGGFAANLRLSSDVIQYYELESQSRPSIRFVKLDVAFMRVGGASNGGLRAMYDGSKEIYNYLRSRHSSWRSMAMVMVKTLQSLTELRMGRCRHERWFAQSLNESMTPSNPS